MNIIVSVVVGLCLFSGVFCNTTDTTGSKCINSQYSDCTCGPVDGFFAYSNCASDQNANKNLERYENQKVCSACTKCIDRTTHDWASENPSANNYVLYIILDSLPVLIWVPLILFFNINLASGPGHSIVFVCQALVALFHISPFNNPGQEGYIFLYLILLSALGLPVLFNAPIQWIWHPQTLTHYSLGYVKVLIAGVLVAVSFFLTTCTQCPLQCCRSPWAKLRRAVRNWKERHLPQRRLLTGVCSVAILMYGSLVEVSFRLLFRYQLPESICQCTGSNPSNASFCCMHDHTASDQSLCWGSPQHWPYFIPAWIMVGVAVLLSLPFFYRPGVPALASRLTRGRVQLPRLHKLAPLFDVFQGVYKPKMQFFTGLHLLYRIALWSVVAFSPTNSKISIFLLLPVVILALHSLFQPFENHRHNYIEALIMVNVALTAVLYSYSFPSFTYESALFPLSIAFSAISLYMVIPLIHIPLVCVIVYYIYKLVRRCCSPRRGEHPGIHAEDEGEVEEDDEVEGEGEVEEDDDSYQGERLEPPQDEELAHLVGDH